MSAYEILLAVETHIGTNFPKLRKAAIDDSPGDIVQPSIALIIAAGKPDWDISGDEAHVACALKVMILTKSLKLTSERIREAFAIEAAVAISLHGIIPDIGCDELEYQGWKDATTPGWRDAKVTVIEISFSTGYKLSKERDYQELESILTQYEQNPGTPALQSQTDFT